ncbi:hypothetical protein PTTG_29286 [Puccinia triticina 1-1 BBBD Race 1]|uniref:Uncharacterized protein n=1 Tax=Puccinia triticina (isolate 1-1 / race 1 (BBBD)) TaxID=630390 RepID=A0A180G4Z0_PUCT1|nr:hypothetical protein PTTG_29286 [Puccinia triticina 1-1 BBBD Race 1]
MSGLNIQDTTNSVKAAPVADEESQMAHQNPTQTQDPDTDANPQGALSQAAGMIPKPTKVEKAAKNKPTTRAMAKNPMATPRAKPPREEAPRGPLRDPETAKILRPASRPTMAKDNPVTIEENGMSD